MSKKPLPPEREVVCGCDVRLQRPVLRDHTGVNERVTACLRCGEVTTTEGLLDQPHPHDVVCVGNIVREQSIEVHRWLAAWPRRLGPVTLWRDGWFLPADARAPDAAALDALEAAERARAPTSGWVERLLVAPTPADPPPATLPPVFSTFADVWHGLRLSAADPVDALFAKADIGWQSPFALRLLARRPTLADEVAARVASLDPTIRVPAVNVVSELRLSSAAIESALRALLERGLERAETHRVLPALEAIGARWSAPLLEAHAETIRADYYEAKYFRDVAKRIAAR